jgi:hypothetical protein
MKITNKFNLPDVLLKFSRNNKYSRGNSSISVTQLISPPRIVSLESIHWDELEQDVSDNLFSILGSAVHLILEQSNTQHNVIAEKRYFATLNGWRISGAIDRQIVEPDGVIIEDWKVTSARALQGSRVVDWENQLNSYAWLLRSAGSVVKQLKINAIIRDFSLRQAGINGYPLAPLQQIDVPLWPVEQQRAYLAARLLHHAEAVMVDPPVCSKEERWAKPEAYALQKIGGKRAIKLFPTLEEAESKLQKGLEVVFRPGEDVRCLYFCRVKKFCDYGKTLGENHAEVNTKLD